MYKAIRPFYYKGSTFTRDSIVPDSIAELLPQYVVKVGESLPSVNAPIDSTPRSFKGYTNTQLQKTVKNNVILKSGKSNLIQQ